MKGWKANENIDFNFYDAHDIRLLTDRASEETVRQRLRERLSSAKQVIVLIGEHSKDLYRFVRWKLEIALKLDLPIIAVNLYNNRSYDSELCPPILRDEHIVHVPFNRKTIKHALDQFLEEYNKRDPKTTGSRHYPDKVYSSLEL
jgi:hypothetical protein